MSAAIRVMLVDAQVERREVLGEALVCEGFHLVACVSPEEDLLGAVGRFAPDVVLIDIESPSRDTLESLRSVQASQPRPMALGVIAALGVHQAGQAARAAEPLREPEKTDLKLGFIKLTDMAPLAIAYEKGYFEDEGPYVTLEAQANWKVLLDRVIDGQLDGRTCSRASRWPLPSGSGPRPA